MPPSWTIAQIPSQIGKRYLITGANSGIGYQAALELARRGATILLACRDRAKGEQALNRLHSEADAPGSMAAAAELILLDLASLASIRTVADDLLARHLALDGLINNAGVMAPTHRLETADGFELQFGTNVLGHFALTCRLLPALELAPSARVVTVSSVAHKRGKLNFADIESRQSYSPMGAYQQSKLADLMFAFELERRLRTLGTNVTSIAVHPGVAQSALFKIGSSQGLAAIAEKFVAATIGLTMNSDVEGALPTLFAATATEAQGGGYYGPQGFQELRGGDVGPAKIAKPALDQRAQQQLWNICEESTGCTLP